MGAGVFSEFFISAMTAPILPSLLEERFHYDAQQIGLQVANLNTALSLSTLIASPVVGLLVPWLGGKKISYLVGLAAMMGGTAAIVFSTSMPVLLLGRTLQGISAAMVWVVGLSILFDVVGPSKLGTTVGSVLSLASLGALLAPVCGGALYDSFGMIGYGAVAAGVLAFDFILRLLVIEPPISQPQNRKKTSQGQADLSSDEQSPLLLSQTGSSSSFAIYAFLLCPPMFFGLMCEFVNGIQLAALNTSIPVHAKTHFHLNALESGLLFLPLSVTSCAVGTLAGWLVDKYGPMRVATLAFFWVAIFSSLLGVPTEAQLPYYAVLLSCCGAGIVLNTSTGIVLSSVYINQYHSEHPQAFGPMGPFVPLFGLFNLVFEGGRTLGPILAEYATPVIGYSNTCIVLGGTSFVAGLACAIYDHISRRQMV
ncbi:Hypothetical protein R9X50_00275600 [Acrodontium crateriforme]|uniref:Major facilitator superfamily (MFS) profile domain-containing protein n=1 Tax=Acrodontium crateriforme TaxID=150365 RepID=A0AAQ3M1U5_9PEZI|nr:Hypothetical protein R9X50_00275600 [Acrodontium crateriforme]